MKYLIGFVLGCALTGGIWYFSNSNVRSPDVAETAASTGINEFGANATPRDATSNADNPNQVSDLNGDPQTQPRAPSSLASSTTVNNSPEPPILTSQGHEKLISDEKSRPPSPRELHEQLQKEPTSPDWSPQMEAQLMEALLSHELISDFSIDQLICKTTLCEIQALGIDGHEKWTLIMHDIGQHDWFKQFSSVSTSANSRDKDAIVLTLLQRKLP